MPRLTLAGHPLHPQLVGFPIGLLPYSLAMDLAYLATRRQSYCDAAYYCMVGGSIGAVAAGAAGAADYLTIRSRTEAKRVANLHALMNLGVLGLYGVNLLLRQGTPKRASALPIVLSAIGTVGLTVSQWYGGKLVYELGMRVKPVNVDDRSPELKLPGDDRLAERMHQMEEFAPQAGPAEQGV